MTTKQSHIIGIQISDYWKFARVKIERSWSTPFYHTSYRSYSPTPRSLVRLLTYMTIVHTPEA